MAWKFNPLTGKFDYYEPAAAAAATPVWETYRKPQRYYSSFSHQNLSSIEFNVNKAYATPFIVPDQQNFDKIAAWVTTAHSSLVFRLGIYENNDDAIYPTDRLLLTAELSGATTGLKEETIDITLDPGLYWLGFNLNNSGVTTRFLGYAVASADVNILTILGSDSADLDHGGRGYQINQAYLTDPLPDPYPGGASVIGYGAMPAIFLRKA